MSNLDLTSVFFLLSLLVGLAQLLGYFFVKLRQPKAVGIATDEPSVASTEESPAAA